MAGLLELAALHRHCIHSFDFLAVKVSPALLILFVNIVLFKNCSRFISFVFAHFVKSSAAWTFRFVSVSVMCLLFKLGFKFCYIKLFICNERLVVKLMSLISFFQNLFIQVVLFVLSFTIEFKINAYNN